MIDEHHGIVQHINEISEAADHISLVAAASQFISLLEAHFDKENRSLLPALNARALLPN